jgi:hypothetical protein
MPQKTLVRQASDPQKKYLVIHPGGVYHPGEDEQHEVQEIVDEAEEKLKAIFDRSDPALASGVKIAVTELF